MAKPEPETCGRCGHPKTEHVAVNCVNGAFVGEALLCPTATFLLDTLQAEMDKL